MAKGDEERGAELAFERELLASAAPDGVPDAAVRAAWSRFAETLGTTAALAHGTPSASAAGAKVTARSALRWLSLGAVGGGAAVAAVFGALALRGAPARHAAFDAVPSAAPPSAAASAVSSWPAASVVVPSSSNAARELQPSHGDERQSDAAAPPAAVSGVHSRRSDGEPRTLAGKASSHGASTLAAEIALLDEARRAASTGDFERALAVLARYRREHPHGELRRESDVLTMETLSRRGDQNGARRLAREFLAAFPDDPHVPRVREFDE